METLMNNILLIVIILLLIFAIAYAVMKFFKLTPKQQLSAIQGCLLYLVIEAEKILKSKTGQAKKSLVLNWLTEKFPFISLFLDEGIFDELLNDTLDEFREMLEENDMLYEYVYGIKRPSVEEEVMITSDNM